MSQLIKNFVVFTVTYTLRSAVDIINILIVGILDDSFVANLVFLIYNLLFLIWEIIPILLMYLFHHKSSQQLKNCA